MNRIQDRPFLFRTLSAGAAALGGLLALIGVIVSIQGDQQVVGTGLLVALALITVLAFGSAVLVIFQPTAGAIGMLLAAGAFAVALVDYVGSWWDGLGTAFSTGGSAISDYWSASGAMLAFQPAVALLVIGAAVAWFGVEARVPQARRMAPA